MARMSLNRHRLPTDLQVHFHYIVASSRFLSMDVQCGGRYRVLLGFTGFYWVLLSIGRNFLGGCPSCATFKLQFQLVFQF